VLLKIKKRLQLFSCRRFFILSTAIPQVFLYRFEPRINFFVLVDPCSLCSQGLNSQTLRYNLRHTSCSVSYLLVKVGRAP